MGKDLGQCLPSSFQNHDFLPNKMQAESNPFENRSLRFPESYGQKKEERIQESVERTPQDVLLDSLQCIIKICPKAL